MREWAGWEKHIQRWEDNYRREQRFVIGNDGADDSRRDERRYLEQARTDDSMPMPGPLAGMREWADWEMGLLFKEVTPPDRRRCSQIRKGRYGIHEECGDTPSQREEFEHQFGVITDDQWQWLKEFVARNRINGN